MSTESTRVLRVPKNISGAQELFEIYAKELNFPSYFGHNWDALDEMLRDLSWLTEHEVILWHEGMPLQNDPRAFSAYVHVLTSALASDTSRAISVLASFPDFQKDELLRHISALETQS